MKTGEGGIGLNTQIAVCVILISVAIYLFTLLDKVSSSEKDRNPIMEQGLFVTSDQQKVSFYITRMVGEGDKQKVCLIQPRMMPEGYFENCVDVESIQYWMKSTNGKITRTNMYRR